MQTSLPFLVLLLGAAATAASVPGTRGLAGLRQAPRLLLQDDEPEAPPPLLTADTETDTETVTLAAADVLPRGTPGDAPTPGTYAFSRSARTGEILTPESGTANISSFSGESEEEDSTDDDDAPAISQSTASGPMLSSNDPVVMDEEASSSTGGDAAEGSNPSTQPESSTGSNPSTRRAELTGQTAAAADDRQESGVFVGAAQGGEKQQTLQAGHLASIALGIIAVAGLTAGVATVWYRRHTSRTSPSRFTYTPYQTEVEMRGLI